MRSSTLLFRLSPSISSQKLENLTLIFSFFLLFLQSSSTGYPSKMHLVSTLLSVASLAAFPITLAAPSPKVDRVRWPQYQKQASRREIDVTSPYPVPIVKAPKTNVFDSLSVSVTEAVRRSSFAPLFRDAR